MSPASLVQFFSSQCFHHDVLPNKSSEQCVLTLMLHQEATAQSLPSPQPPLRGRTPASTLHRSRRLIHLDPPSFGGSLAPEPLRWRRAESIRKRCKFRILLSLELNTGQIPVATRTVYIIYNLNILITCPNRSVLHHSTHGG